MFFLYKGNRMLEYHLDIGKASRWIITTQHEAAKAMPFFLTEIGCFFAGEKYFTKRGGRSGYYLAYTADGLGEMRTSGEPFEIPAGYAALVFCETPHFYRTAPGGKWTQMWMHLDGAGVPAYFAQLADIPVKLADPDAFLRLFNGLIEQSVQTDIVTAAEISSGISRLLTDMLVSHLRQNSPKRQMLHAGIEEALRFIHENYEKPVSIDDIVAGVNLSKYHFLRLFRKHIGATPYQYLIHYRINQSKRLLCTTDAAISEISARVGYLSESNFISQFRRVTGMSPTAFRKSNLSYVSGDRAFRRTGHSGMESSSRA